MSILTNLVELLDVKKIEENVYMGHAQDIGYPALYGGQVIGQALRAAQNTVVEKIPHSLHAYFLRAGNVVDKIYFEVDLTRTGASFVTRNVVAKQSGRAILTMSVSFHNSESDGFDHQDQAPTVPSPEDLPNEEDLLKKLEKKIPETIRAKILAERPFDIRVVDPIDYISPHRRPALKYTWFKAKHDVPNETLIQAALLAYASDHGFSLTALLPHGVSMLTPGYQFASIDHALWLHRPVDVSRWHLYETTSPNAHGARGFNRGNIYDEKGRLVASVAQECLIRKVKNKKSTKKRES